MKPNFKARFCHRAVLLTATVVTILISNTAAKTARPTSDTIQTRNGVLRITPKFHGSFQIEFAGLLIEIDPVSAASYTRKADYILITHAHGDHFDPAVIKKLVIPGTTVVAPEPIRNKLQSTMKAGTIIPMGNGDFISGSHEVSRRRKLEITIEAVPMYNLVRERAKGQKFHPKGIGNGYILTLGGRRIYIAGDTEATPEMKKLKNIDIAFLPMNLPFTMTPQEAARGARAFKPKIIYPYHFRYPFNKVNTYPHQFAAALKGSGIQVRVRDWYPAAAVARATAAAKK